MQTFLVILFVIVALGLVLAAAVSQLCGPVHAAKGEADAKDAELIRDIEQWRSGL